MYDTILKCDVGVRHISLGFLAPFWAFSHMTHTKNLLIKKVGRPHITQNVESAVFHFFSFIPPIPQWLPQTKNWTRISAGSSATMPLSPLWTSELAGWE